MPEIVTKYPDILLQELKDAGGQCGVGVKPDILKSCPHDRFCQLPTGEICVYDLKSAASMTQIKPAEWSEVITGIPPMFGISNLLLLILIFGIGIAIGTVISK